MAKRLIYAALMVAFMLPLIGAAPVYTGGGGGGSSVPGLIVPDTMFVASGRECNIWHGQLSTIPFGGTGDGSDVSVSPMFFSVIADSGLAKNRSFRWTPAENDTFDMTIKAYDYGGKLAQQSSFAAQSTYKNKGVGTKYVIFTGDSMFDGGLVAFQVDSVFTLDGGGDIACVGTQLDYVYHEAHGGKTWEWYIESTSPFWDSGDSEIDFQYYSTNSLGGLTPDYMVISLGGNEAIIAATAGNTLDNSVVITQATAFLDTLSSSTHGWPNCRVIINLQPNANALPSAFGASGQGYNAEFDPVLYMNNARGLARSYISSFDGGNYSSLVDVCAGGWWVDPVYGFLRTSGVAVSARSSETETYAHNFLHPDTDGFNQLADALYSHLRHFHELDEPTNCTNEMLDSHSFTNATYWTDYSSYWAMTPDQSDPWGGTSATKFTGTASVTSLNIAEVDRWQQGGDITFSAYIKNGNLGTTDRTEIALRNHTDSTDAWLRITWTTTPTFAYSGYCSDGDLIYLGDGWYQAWGTLDNTTNASDDMYIKINPCTTPVQNDEVYIGGAQVEFGVIEPCGVYVETP